MLKEQQITCKLVSPKPSKGNYISNQEALELFENIQSQGQSEIVDPKVLKKFNSTIEQFKQDINRLEINNDTVDTYLHKLRTLLGC